LLLQDLWCLLLLLLELVVLLLVYSLFFLN
jgi:hypothetical protein